MQSYVPRCQNEWEYFRFYFYIISIMKLDVSKLPNWPLQLLGFLRFFAGIVLIWWLFFMSFEQIASMYQLDENVLKTIYAIVWTLYIILGFGTVKLKNRSWYVNIVMLLLVIAWLYVNWFNLSVFIMASLFIIYLLLKKESFGQKESPK